MSILCCVHIRFCGVYSFVCTLHYLIIIMMQTYLKVLNFSNACHVPSVECVPKIKWILSIIFHTIYAAVCIQLTHFSYDDWDNTRTLSYHHHHQIGSMTPLPMLKAKPWNNGKHCMSFYILIALYWTVSYRDVIVGTNERWKLEANRFTRACE